MNYLKAQQKDMSKDRCSATVRSVIHRPLPPHYPNNAFSAFHKKPGNIWEQLPLDTTKLGMLQTCYHN
jgi:hypothetical protein